MFIFLIVLCLGFDNNGLCYDLDLWRDKHNMNANCHCPMSTNSTDRKLVQLLKLSFTNDLFFR